MHGHRLSFESFKDQWRWNETKVCAHFHPMVWLNGFLISENWVGTLPNLPSWSMLYTNGIASGQTWKPPFWVRKWACCAISPTTATKKTSSPYADHKHDPFLEIRSQSSTKMCLLHQLQERNEAVMMVVWNPVFTWPWIATVGYALGLSGYKYEQAVSKGSIWTISVVHPGTFQVQ